MGLISWLNKYRWYHHKYSKGHHIKHKTFLINSKNGKYRVDVASLFYPLQIGEESELYQELSAAEKEIVKKSMEKRIGEAEIYKKSEPKKYEDKLKTLEYQKHIQEGISERRRKKINKKHLVPYGGDLFSLSIQGARLNFFAVDIQHHGHSADAIAREIAKVVKRYRKSPSLLNSVAETWKNERNKIHERALKRFEKALKHIQKYYDPRIIHQHAEVIRGFNTRGHMAGAQTTVDLDQMPSPKILFESFGVPDTYLILMDPEGKISMEHFPKGLRSAWWFSLKSTNVKKFLYDKMPKDVRRFRIVMFTDAVEEQGFSLDSLGVKEIEKILDTSMSNRHTKFLSKPDESTRNFTADKKLLHDTIKHMINKPPKEFVHFFYKYYVRYNLAKQHDDITLVVADFEKVA